MPSLPSGRDSKSAAPPEGERTPDSAPVPGEVYFEFTPVGAYMKVVAIDAATGIEVSIVGASNADQATLERTALAKLRYVLEKRRR